jgi:hypothetical protein
MFVLFPMIHMSVGLGLVFGSDWMRAAKPPAPPAVAAPGWFTLNPRRSLWQRLRAWLTMMMLWYGVGALAIGHYFLNASSPYGTMAWIVSSVYVALGLIPAWGWLYHFLLMRRTSDPIVMTSVARFPLGQSFDVRLVHPMHRQTMIESLKLGLVRAKHVKTRNGNKTQYNTVVDFETWQTLLKDHPAQADETIQQSAGFTVPQDGLPSSFGEYPRYEWKLEVKAALKDSPDYRAEYMILVEDAGRAASRAIACDYPVSSRSMYGSSQPARSRLAFTPTFNVLSLFNRFNAIRHSREKFSAPWLLRIRRSSSPKLTSSCQCRLFSTLQ